MVDILTEQIKKDIKYLYTICSSINDGYVRGTSDTTCHDYELHPINVE